MKSEDKVKVFSYGLEQFETDKMKLYCEDMIKQMPDYLFYMPSSTTGKWHNPTQCQAHGQIYHIIMFAEIVNYRLALKAIVRSLNLRNKEMLSDVWHIFMMLGSLARMNRHILYLNTL